MPCKKIRTEYMKRFREPQWSQFGQCYQELLHYRLSRRLLEQAHNPWLWPGEGTSECSSDRQSPEQPEPAPLAVSIGEAEHPDTAVQNNAAPQLPLIIATDQAGGGEKIHTHEKSASGSQPSPSQRALCKQAGHKLGASPERSECSRKMRRPFALYAAGEKRKDTGSQKTHNVCAPTSATEIHDSALRAKNRRQKEKRKQLLQKQRADTERNVIRKSSPPENPWLSEYMRCYSARAR
ncbi:centriole, cilia and spindle-associated protein [Ambystoma mexicanum]|uniref:centriole, cilia and spindle-associated protein n=1 Tax=Ambystoma mexicanum TaxID=8296 RepID=UPI0037E989ED